jgi:hypothetical protein
MSEKVKSPTIAMNRFNDALRSVLQVSKNDGGQAKPRP